MARVRSNTLVRLRSSGINTVVAIDLSKRQLARLRNLNGGAGMSLLVPQRSSRCRHRTSATCVVRARSRAAGLRLSRQRGVDLAVVRISGPRQLDAISARRGRILALAKLGRGRFNASTWRRAIDRAANDSHLDLAVQPLGRAGERALASYLRVFAPGGAPTLEDVDGGPNYYRQFSNPLPDNPAFFPVAAWGTYNHRGTTNGVRNINLDAQAGLNTYVWVADPCAQIPLIRSDGRFHVIYEESENRSCKGSESSGWFLADELDMTCGPAPRCYDQLQNAVNGLPNDGQLRYNNYGKGVLLWESNADAARWVNGKAGGNTFQQIVATDLYWFTDPNERGGPRYGFASSYGDDVAKVRRLDALDGKRQPVWHVIETGWPFTESAAQGGRAIRPDELRAATWHALIAGARGINWFVHSFGGPHAGDHNTLRSNREGTRPEVTAVNAQIKALAPVLNSPFVTSGHSATDTMNGNIRTMVKWSGGKFYLFAGADRGGGNATFSIPCVGNATATRLAPSNRSGEAASIPINSGRWTDSFADKNAVHIYRIDGGSSCGL